MKQVLIIVAVIAATALIPATASAASYAVPCREAYGQTELTFRTKPTNCVFGGRFGATQAIVRNIRWRSWGGRTAYGKGTLRGNMGFRARIRFKLSRAVRYEETFFIYRKLTGTIKVRGEAPFRYSRSLPVY